MQATKTFIVTNKPHTLKFLVLDWTLPPAPKLPLTPHPTLILLCLSISVPMASICLFLITQTHP